MRVTFPRFPVWNFTFPERDVRRISGVTYWTTGGQQHELSADKYRLAIGRNGVSSVVFLDKPSLPQAAKRADAVAVEYEV